MQTFLPLPSFADSARCLDDRRLGKQRVEAWQILRALRGESQGWRNHPAVRMWRGHDYWLVVYGASCCAEWVRRGFRDTMSARFAERVPPVCAIPLWMTEAFHASHRAVLLAKDPAWYGRFGWTETPAVRDKRGRWPYLWPV